MRLRKSGGVLSSTVTAVHGFTICSKKWRGVFPAPRRSMVCPSALSQPSYLERRAYIESIRLICTRSLSSSQWETVA